MKFRVETWDTTERRAGWVQMAEGNEPMQSWLDYYANVRVWCSTTTLVRLRQRGMLGWVTNLEGYGKKETKPMASRVVYDCGCASCGEDFYPCSEGHDPRWKPKETKPMSTKQRGDVEKIAAVPQPDWPEKFKIRIKEDGYTGAFEPTFAFFTRDEFRRIWEAGNAEFNVPGWVNTEAMRKEDQAKIYRLNMELAEKDAEIARLKDDVANHREQVESSWRQEQRLKLEVERLHALKPDHVNCNSTYREDKAEIARLRKLATENADLHIQAEAEVAKERARKEQLLQMWTNARREIEWKEKQLKVLQETYTAAENERLRGWLDRWRDRGYVFSSDNEVGRALAGEKVPE